ncbi:hypothetical protein BC830DRAFT_169642, partial [Chytriomyces sp. MP71]
CDWAGQDLKGLPSVASDCSKVCSQNAGCTHFTWTDYNGGTCWMKSGAVSPSSAVVLNSPNALCGYMVPASFATTTSTQKTVPPSPPPTTTNASPVASSTGSSNCSSKWGQCGGIGWTGPTCCLASSCTLNSPYYSQCL